MSKLNARDFPDGPVVKTSSNTDQAGGTLLPGMPDLRDCGVG